MTGNRGKHAGRARDRCGHHVHQHQCPCFSGSSQLPTEETALVAGWRPPHLSRDTGWGLERPLHPQSGRRGSEAPHWHHDKKTTAHVTSCLPGPGDPRPPCPRCLGRAARRVSEVKTEPNSFSLGSVPSSTTRLSSPQQSRQVPSFGKILRSQRRQPGRRPTKPHVLTNRVGPSPAPEPA